jgi:hypothetical protein
MGDNSIGIEKQQRQINSRTIGNEEQKANEANSR